LFAEPFLLREEGSGTRELFDIFAHSHGFNITPIWESSSTQALINGVAKGLGISVLPYNLVNEYLKSGVICSLNIKNINLSRNYYIIHHTRKHLSNLTKAFIKIIKDFTDNVI
jgi:DNA-binding transcriptional LysR family regulator